MDLLSYIKIQLFIYMVLVELYHLNTFLYDKTFYLLIKMYHINDKIVIYSYIYI